METPIGVIIKEIANEKNIKMGQLAELSGRTRQGMYVVFGRSDMKNEEIEEWAGILGVSKDYIFNKWKNNGKSDTSVDSEYLLKHLAALEHQFKAQTEQSKALADQLQSQLAVKDKQIERLMDLLGKLSPASDESKVLSHPALMALVA
ncbi:hypothetical protein SAMN04487996_12295 [Dyadobacter soli]|uniref:Uncharacterized protein n=1 Tax=Dyadobacter soli TaxID=659014 RepID=A0A1G7WLR9_9BACT|nr:helix-turn-helix transcriptional regulator [Dyadobacter soli]SDG72862.1 hypothetical protein SAMN04487996_12295 [Dyadobacter soli]